MRTKQVRAPKLKYEYQLFISYEYDIILKRYYILFDFRTVKIFRNFKYTINVEKNIYNDKRIIEFNVEGLSAPVVDFSQSGHASYTFKFYDFLYDTYQLKLFRNGKNPIIYKINISINKITVLEEPKKTFLELIIKE
ncbi:MAG: hypothetical protein N2490_01805 [Ignavibacteria bacterium]|nr:hypothetical protein [Ignavibacteria bacterium]